MTLGSKEFYEVIAAFEKSEFAKGKRLDKESRELQARGHVYQNGELNELYRAFQLGYAFCKSIQGG